MWTTVLFSRLKKFPCLAVAAFVAIEEVIADHCDRRNTSSIAPAGHGRRAVGGVAIAMKVDEEVSFHPGVGSVEIKAVILAVHNHVVNEMNDRRRPITAGEVNDVTVANRATEKVVDKNAVSPGFDSTSAVSRFEFLCSMREVTIAHYKRGTVERYVLMFGREKVQVIQKHGPAARMNRRCAVEFNISESDSRFR
jgi:hypothetical protein